MNVDQQTLADIKEHPTGQTLMSEGGGDWYCQLHDEIHQGSLVIDHEVHGKSKQPTCN
jgi:hypothetical protein